MTSISLPAELMEHLPKCILNTKQGSLPDALSEQKDRMRLLGSHKGDDA